MSEGDDSTTASSTEQHTRNETKNAVVKESSGGDQLQPDPDVSNHHSIPRQKFSGWENNPGPISNNSQTKDGNAVDNHA